jgi:membrane protease YdiL (CAAX protease family)
LLGLLFGVLRERHGSLLAPALAHVVHNTTMVATTLLLPSLFHQVFSR